MLKLGEKQTLEIMKKVEFGVYLKHPEDATGEERVLLPAKQVPGGMGIGDTIEVFLYKDSKDRLIATTKTPLLLMNEVKMLKVAQVGKMGAFLEWGLEKDLFLPFREQTKKVREGEECLVALYIDKSERLCATMKIYERLSAEHSYKKGDYVTGVIYEMKEFGAMVAVDKQYYGLIPKKEIHRKMKVGETVEARVTAIRPDGKIDLSLSKAIPMQMNDDAQMILEVIQSYDGVLPYNDKAKPQTIERDFHISKNAFKRAVGQLLKQGKIEITDTSIRLK